MLQRIRAWSSRRRAVVLIAAGLLLIAIVAGAAAGGLAWFRGRGRSAVGQASYPALVDTSSGGEVAASPAGGIVVERVGGAVVEGVVSKAAVPGGGGGPIVLSAGQAQPAAFVPLPVATGEPLSEAEIERILARLPPLATGGEDQVDFRLPPEPLPPPRPGDTVKEPFPPPPEPATPEPVPAGPLHVLRYGPEGEIALAPFVDVTFDQPMVPLATLETLAAGEVPVRIEPALPGTWKWLGTKTLRFEYDSTAIDRLPMATEYVVTVPAGTRSATGGVLEAEVRWTFSTPPPVLALTYPEGEAQPLEPVLVIGFDQRVNPERVLDTVQVTADGRAVPVRLATEAELAADEGAARAVGYAVEGRWLALVAEEPLPADAAIQVVVGPGTPSAEGPLVTVAAQSYGFHTYAPLRIESHGCGWYYNEGECPPLTPWTIQFNNPIDVDAYQEEMLRIEPAVPDALVEVIGATLSIRGSTAGRTTYRITVRGDIRDTFGQTLGADAVLTIKVGPAAKALFGPQEALVTLDPAASKPVLSVYAINYTALKVRAYRVAPSDWPTFKLYLQNAYRTDVSSTPPGELVLDKKVPLEAPADALVEAGIDLSPALKGGLGQLVVVIEPTDPPTDEDRYQRQVRVWVQSTRIGLDAFSDHSEMVAWTTDLRDGSPLGDVTIEDAAGQRLGATGADGTARFALPEQNTGLLVARLGDDLAILPRSIYMWAEDGWMRRPVEDELRWYVWDDRGMYRPGEEVHVKGWLRRIGGGQGGDVGLPGAGLQAVRYQVIGSQGNELLNGQAPVNALGGFDLAFTLPENANLGYTQLYLQAENVVGLGGWDYRHSFQVQEFRRPEFEVVARNETTGPYLAGGYAVVAVEASYYAGGPLPNADVTWQVTYSPGSYAPPNWPGFVFGKWTPWWWGYGWGGQPPEGESQLETFTGVTDATGNHYLRLDFEPSGELRPLSVKAEATVMDVNRQAWAGATTLLVHPAEVYVGLRSERTFVQRGDPLPIELIVTGIDGTALPDRAVQVEAARLEWRYRQGAWRQEAVDVQTCAVSSALDPVSCTFETPKGGEIQITATVRDDAGRANQSQFTRWVSGGERPPARKVEQETVTLIPDKESYQPGEVAQILVQSPFSPAEGLLTVSRSGILYSERFTVQEGTATVQVPIAEEHIPNLVVQVDLAGAAPRTDDHGQILAGATPRPAYASGQLLLPVPPLQRTLALQVAPRETELEPGGETVLDLALTDAAGRPVADAELAVVVVDEAILALTQYQLADPLAIFYSERDSDMESTYARASIVLAQPEEVQGALGGRMVAETVEVEKLVEKEVAMPAGADTTAAAAQPIRVRSDFNPLATFAPAVRTGADGRAEVPISLPDNLTRYRVMVVAVAGGSQFGSGEANLTARLPLMVRPSAPRFLNFGDQLELPVVVQNQTGQPLNAEVVARGGNLELTGSRGLRVTVPARDRVEVRFPAAAVLPGTARVQVAAVAGAFADAAAVELPVYTPATTEAFATYGTVDEGAVAQPVAEPQGVYPQFGGLEISTSSTALQALTDAVLYLSSYPYECTEQMASRILAIAALRDVLSAFSAPGLPPASELEGAVARDVERLAGLQNDDGGFPYWRRGRESIPFHTIHVAHALRRAQLKGFAVPEAMQSRALDYLRDIESHYPSWYDKTIRQTLSAYALYVRDLSGERDPAKARALLDEAGVENLSLEAVAWLWQVIYDDPGSASQVEAIRRHLNNRAVETAGTASFSTSYGDQAYLLLHSDRRTDAVVLDALIAGDPQNDLIPKVVNGLLAHRTRGRWGNTQENVFILLALDRYFSVYEAQTPEFVARIWLGDTYVGSHEYVGRTTERHETTIPMPYLVAWEGEGEVQSLILSKEGPGRLYYRLGLRYAPTDLDLDPLDMGFVVQRSYEGVDDLGDVYRDAEGVWHVKAGARVRVNLSMVADSRRYHVALVDPLPAGLEIVNPALAVSGDVPQDPSSPTYRYGWWWWGPWYEHQNMRDERAEAFTPLLWEGTYTYSYVARATTPGRFVAPPAKAEEMYSPEVFGRSGSDWVIVE